MRIWLTLFISIGLLSACDGNIGDYVSKVRREPTVETSTGDRSLKVSPGHVQAAGNNLAADMTVTPTKVNAVGTHTSATLTINSGRH